MNVIIDPVQRTQSRIIITSGTSACATHQFKLCHEYIALTDRRTHFSDTTMLTTYSSMFAAVNNRIGSDCDIISGVLIYVCLMNDCVTTYSFTYDTV